MIKIIAVLCSLSSPAKLVQLAEWMKQHPCERLAG